MNKRNHKTKRQERAVKRIVDSDRPCALSLGHKGPCDYQGKPAGSKKAYDQVLTAAVKWFRFQVSMAKEDGMHDEDSVFRSVQALTHDVIDLVTIAFHIDSGQIGKAADKANMLDTIVRDQIPSAAWKLFERHWEDDWP